VLLFGLVKLIYRIQFRCQDAGWCAGGVGCWHMRVRLIQTLMLLVVVLAVLILVKVLMLESVHAVLLLLLLLLKVVLPLPVVGV